MKSLVIALYATIIPTLVTLGVVMLDNAQLWAGIFFGIAWTLIAFGLLYAYRFQKMQKVVIGVQKSTINYVDEEVFELILEGFVRSRHQEAVTSMELWVHPRKAVQPSLALSVIPDSVDFKDSTFHVHFNVPYTHVNQAVETYGFNEHVPPCALSMHTSKASNFVACPNLSMISLKGSSLPGVIINCDTSKKPAIRLNRNQIIGETKFIALTSSG